MYQTDWVKSGSTIPILRDISQGPLTVGKDPRTWFVESSKGAELLVLRPAFLPDKVFYIHQAMGPVLVTLSVHISGGGVELHGVVVFHHIKQVDYILVLLHSKNLQQVTRSCATTWTELIMWSSGA